MGENGTEKEIKYFSESDSRIVIVNPSVCLSVWNQNPSDSDIEPIDHQAYQPSSLSTIKPIDHRAYQPLVFFRDF